MTDSYSHSHGGNGRHSNGRLNALPRRGPEPFTPRLAAWRALNETDPRHPDAAENLRPRIDRPQASDADRRLATQLVMGTLRHRARLDHCLAQVLDKPLNKQREPILNLLRLGAFQILYLEHPTDYAIVNETVEAARLSEMRDAAPLVNAVLRNFLRRREELAAPVATGDVNRDFAIEHSCPEWARDMLDAGLSPAKWRPWWIAAQQTPDLHLRVNTLRIHRDALVAELRAAGFEADAAPAPDGVVVRGVQRPGDLACFEEGRATVQDAAATLVGWLLAPREGERIVDFCAAPGGKTTHIAALTNNRADILASDASKPRLQEAIVAARRMGATRVRFEVASQLLLAQYGGWADAVLVDAPCTGMGTIRRHPEIRWLRDREAVIQSSLKQLTILGLAQQLVRPGGRLLYSTCTLFHEENQRLIETFLYQYRHFRLEDLRPTAPEFVRPWLDADGTLLTSLHTSFAQDGFFAALLRRSGG